MRHIADIMREYFKAELAKVKVEMERAEKNNDAELANKCAHIIAIIEQVEKEYENYKSKNR